MIINKLKKLKPFHIIGIVILLGLLYGSVNLYNKIQFFKSFANQTRITSVVAEKAVMSSINKIYPATSVIESNQSYEVISKTEGILNDIFFKHEKKNILPSGPLNDLINKFANTNYLSLEIKSSRERQNELKISFSKSSLAIKYMLD